MHNFAIVIGNDICDQLRPYSEYYYVKPYKTYISEDGLKSMAEHYRIPLDDLSLLRKKMKDWVGYEGFIDYKRLWYWNDRNPDEKYDGYKIGGRFSNILKLKTSRSDSEIMVSQAEFGKLDKEHLKKTVPDIVIKDGLWIEDEDVSCSYFVNDNIKETWRKRYVELLENLSDNTLITAVDIHS